MGWQGGCLRRAMNGSWLKPTHFGNMPIRASTIVRWHHQPLVKCAVTNLFIERSRGSFRLNIQFIRQLRATKHILGQRGVTLAGCGQQPHLQTMTAFVPGLPM